MKVLGCHCLAISVRICKFCPALVYFAPMLKGNGGGAQRKLW